ncbi:MAG: hypothetical protein ABFR89_08540 [Actinomycetota bacterium]
MSLLRIGAGVEMTGDRLFAHRVRRLVGISAVALGVIWGLAYADGGPGWVLALLAIGWAVMPVVLGLSLRRPIARYALVLPASAVPVGLIGMVAAAPEATVTGWVIVTAGILLGGFLGLWFWFRWLPVPRILDDPFGWPRMVLVGLHTALVFVGAVMVGAGL